MHRAPLCVLIMLAALVTLSFAVSSALPLLLGVLVLGVAWLGLFADLGLGS